MAPADAARTHRYEKNSVARAYRADARISTRARDRCLPLRARRVNASSRSTWRSSGERSLATEAVLRSACATSAPVSKQRRVDVRPHVRRCSRLAASLPQLGASARARRCSDRRFAATPFSTPRHPACATANRPVGDTTITGTQSAKHSSAAIPGTVATRASAPASAASRAAIERLGRRVVELHHDFPVHLAGHHERNVGRIERFQHERSVALDRRRAVAHVITQVERGIRAFAHPARASGERDAHARALVQGIVGKRRKTTRAESARGYLRDGQLSGRDHQATAPYRWRFRKSGM